MVIEHASRGSTGLDEHSRSVRKQIRNTVLALFAREDTQDILEVHCASDELLDVWDEKEQRATLEKQSCHALPEDVRRVVVGHLAYLLTNLGMNERAWFDAVTVFDAYCGRAGSGTKEAPAIRLSDVPALCVAIAKVMRKLDNSEDYSPREEYIFKEFLKHVAQWLEALDYDFAGWELVSTNVQEHRILKATALCLPNVETWLLAMCTRINVIAQRVLIQTLNARWQQAMNGVWQRGIRLAQNFLLHRTATADIKPRQLAQGLLALGLTTSRLLPVEAMHLDGLSAPEWEWLQRETERSDPIATFVMHQDEFMMELLQAATGTQMDLLIKDCQFVLRLLSSFSAASANMVKLIPDRSHFV